MDDTNEYVKAKSFGLHEPAHTLEPIVVRTNDELCDPTIKRP